ncbi:small subunit ribosomal protein S17 [Arthrobacter sp. PL16]|jgi:small subunit ribosomal protein S17|uniref:Small ribosomal subunit protein uS17 n=1 Tax=Arthrobacter cheniae TaxID=1258888 RepID=A0A3A5MET2_9MICC|nr:MULTISPECIES: 30S ribosomal protein S17 [Arthrobacter]MEC5199124.1 small subunit ribosomal protein S17 [Arthrobacter sp. PL16]RJT82978.1 30S ribosomal protein S17 [Arthrobacter cheniae]
MSEQKSEEVTVGTETAVHDADSRGYRKVRRGYVTSDKMNKTIVVEVEDRVKHALYGKVLRRSSKVKVHDEENIAGIGDHVLISETRPLSATKRWRLVEILEKAK